MDALIFEYTNSKSETKIYSLTKWVEQGFYLRGHHEGHYKTFRKDRVDRYLEGDESILNPAAPAPPNIKTHAPKDIDDRLIVLFTGFKKADKQGLESKSESAGIKPSKSKRVTRSLNFLVYGPLKSGAKKMQAAIENNIYIMSESQFLEMLETGVLPDDPDHLIPEPNVDI